MNCLLLWQVARQKKQEQRKREELFDEEEEAEDDGEDRWRPTKSKGKRGRDADSDDSDDEDKETGIWADNEAEAMLGPGGDEGKVRQGSCGARTSPFRLVLNPEFLG